MSERSKKRADKFQEAKDKKALADTASLIHKETLDKGFSEIRTALAQSVERQSDESNQEATIGNILRCNVSDDSEWTVTRTDTGAALKISLDSLRHKITLNCAKPTKFAHTVEVRPTGSGLWYYADAKEQVIEGSTESVADIVASRALDALLGLDWKAK